MLFVHYPDTKTQEFEGKKLREGFFACYVHERSNPWFYARVDACCIEYWPYMYSTYLLCHDCQNFAWSIFFLFSITRWKFWKRTERTLFFNISSSMVSLFFVISLSPVHHFSYSFHIYSAKVAIRPLFARMKKQTIEKHPRCPIYVTLLYKRFLFFMNKRKRRSFWYIILLGGMKNKYSMEKKNRFFRYLLCFVRGEEQGLKREKTSLYFFRYRSNFRRWYIF